MTAARGDDTCWSLIGRAATGDAGARSAFGRSYLPLVRAFLAARWRGTALAGEVEDAADCFATAIELAPKFPDAHHNLGDARIEQKRTEEAIECYRAALALAPRDVLTMNNLALALERVGEMDASMAMLREWLAIDPGNGPANLNLGRRLEAMGDVVEALVYWRRAELTWRHATDPFGRQWHGKVLATIAKAEAQLGNREQLRAVAKAWRAFWQEVGNLSTPR